MLAVRREQAGSLGKAIEIVVVFSSSTWFSVFTNPSSLYLTHTTFLSFSRCTGSYHYRPCQSLNHPNHTSCQVHNHQGLCQSFFLQIIALSTYESLRSFSILSGKYSDRQNHFGRCCKRSTTRTGSSSVN